MILQTFRTVMLCSFLISSLSFVICNADVKIMRDLRIVGGQITRPNQFPHAVALILHMPHSHTSFCGGSIIHANYVLTAAHCLDNVLRIQMMAGVHSIFNTDSEINQLIEPRDFRQHPRYNTNTLINDIALIFLRRRLTFTNRVQPIQLPLRNQARNRFVGSTGTIVGWGRTRDSSQALSNQLRSVSLRIVPDQVCDIYNYEYLYFTPTNICVDGTYGSSCGGDSGSGMHMTLNGRLSLIGVVSYGTATCEDGHPVAMTRVTSYLDWIASNTGLRI